MERMPSPRRHGGDRAERWLLLARDGGIALVGVAALAGLARDLSATRGPVVAWIIVTLLGAAAGLFAWSLLEARDAGHEPHSGSVSRPSTSAGRELPADDFDPRLAVPLVPRGLFPSLPRPRPSSVPGHAHQVRRAAGPDAQSAPRNVRMRTRRTRAACAAAHTHRPAARATHRRPPTTA